MPIRFVNVCIFLLCFSLYTYSQKDKDIDSLKRLPSSVLYKLDKYLTLSFGNMKNDLVFESGADYDLDQYFKNDSTSFLYFDSAEYCDFQPFPKYVLFFKLEENSLGILYKFSIDLDTYGQLLSSIAWPCSGYSRKENFIPINRIKDFVVVYSKNKKYKIKDFTYNFDYDYVLKKMVWNFYFPIKTYLEQCLMRTDLHVIVVDAINLIVLQDYKSWRIHPSIQE